MTTAANDDRPDRLAITEDDLRAYAEDRLDGPRRREVAGYLACNPDLAAEVMTRLHMASPGPPRRRGRRALRAAVLGLSVVLGAGVGWAAAERHELDGWREADGGTPPDYVEEAAESREAVDLRGRMDSQIETARLDAGEIRSQLAIHIPALPRAWQVRDVQVFPTDTGPSVNLVLEAPDRRRLQLFAVRVTSADRRPEIAARGDERVVFWQRDGAAYVLSGPRSRTELLSDAAALGEASNL